MSFKSLKQALLFKTEVTYGVDAVPTGVANAILAANVKPAMPQDMPQRKNIQPFFANQGVIPGARHMELAFDVELAGSGAAGTAPALGALLKACAMSETINAGVSAVYAPVSSGEQSASIYYNVDGLQYKLLGARGTFSLKFSQKAVPMLSFKFIGLYGGVADVALPAPTLTAFKSPLVFDNANSQATLHGLAATFADVSLDMGITNVYRPLIGGEQVAFTDRKPKGKVQIEQIAIATHDFWTTVNNGTTGALSITHGTAAGNKILVAAPAVQLTTPAPGNSENIEMLDMAMELQPGAGNDELTLTFE